VVSLDNASEPLRVVPSTPATVNDDLETGAARGFDLATDLPFRATLFAVAADEHVLLLVVHHSAADGWSMTPLLDDLSTAYGARRAGRPPGFERRAGQYGAVRQ